MAEEYHLVGLMMLGLTGRSIKEIQPISS